MVHSLLSRLAALERRLAGEDFAEAELRAMVEAVARERDLPVDELLDETRRVLVMTPAEQEAAIADVIAHGGSTS